MANSNENKAETCDDLTLIKVVLRMSEKLTHLTCNSAMKRKKALAALLNCE